MVTVQFVYNGGREREWMICDHSALYCTLHFNCSLHTVDLSCQDPPLRSHIPVFTLVRDIINVHVSRMFGSGTRLVKPISDQPS